MKFYDKLPKIRKNNNLSQEQLAERLGMSRQAISKWEAGLSYPDMEKMIELCKILNCQLDDLLDDGIIGDNNLNNPKKRLTDYFQDFLKYITKVYNMFLAMQNKEKIKCIFELILIVFFLSLFGTIFYSFIQNIGSEFYYYDFKPVYFIILFLSFLIKTAIFIVNIIIIVHLFNIRYLNYYITIEDNNIKKKVIEPIIEEEKNHHFKEKIIIRDPKDSSATFFDLFGKIIIILFKFLIILISVPLIFSFVFLIFLAVLSLCYVSYTSLFLYNTIFIIGLILLTLIILIVFYYFLFNKKINFNHFFNVFICSLFILGVSGGLITNKILQFDFLNNTNDLKKYTTTLKVNISENTHLFNLDYLNTHYIIDNNLTNVQIEINSIIDLKNLNIPESNYLNDENFIYINISDFSFKPIFDLVLNDLKNKKIRNYTQSDIVDIKIYLNEHDYNVLQKNNYR